MELLLSRFVMERGNSIRRRFAALIGGLVVTVGVLATPEVAGADQISDKKAEAEAIAAKIRDLDHQIEQAAEEANRAQAELDQIAQQIADSQAQVDAARAAEEARRGELRSYAIDAYVNGTASSKAAQSTDADLFTIGEREGYLTAASANRQQLVDELRASQEDLNIKVGQLNQAKGEAEAKKQILDQRRTQAESAVAQQNQLYDKAQGELQQLVAEAQAREAARQQAAAEARRRASAAASSVSSVAGGSGPVVRGGVDAVIAEAKRQLGKPYVWGASGPDAFDCSGFTAWAWRAGGVNLPHYSGSQYASTTHVSMSAIQPGDLIFYEDPGQHVALYIGNGTIIHAPNSRSVVRYDSLYYWDTAMMASRP